MSDIIIYHVSRNRQWLGYVVTTKGHWPFVEDVEKEFDFYWKPIRIKY